MTEDKDPHKMLPSEKGDYYAEQEKKAKDLFESRQSMMREDFGRTFQTAHGQRVLAWFAERCGWGRPPLSANKAGDIDMMITTHNAMELSLYIVMRRFISVDVLQQVEYGKIKPSGTILDDEGEGKRKASKPKKKRK